MGLTPTCDVFIIAGEPSGDAYGAAILEELRRRQPDTVCAAMGGPELAKAGAEVEQDIEGLAVMGLFPVLARLPQFIRLGLRMAHLVRQRKPKVVLTIDYPGFNLRLARRLADVRHAGTRFVHVVAPQVWAWKPRRAKSVAHSIDRLLCFFPFEPPLFSRFGCRADFIGHPLVDLVAKRFDTSGIDRALGIDASRPLLLLAPGSREREVSTLLPIYHHAAEAAMRRTGQVAVAIAKVPDLPMDLYRRHSHFPLIEGHFRELCARAHLGLIASGTATLEAGIIGLPHIIAYRMDRITAAIARQVIRTEHVGLPNLVLERRACPEVLQDQLTVPRLVAHIERLWAGPAREACRADLVELRQRLGAGGAIATIANILAEELEIGRRRETQVYPSGNRHLGTDG
ncbi:MAG: lipid-A-disaccharide synthase [Planctomycetes bacterium]|nr:lipid-A-disaccharide synthase [Planctomycetota bacterium]